MKTFILFAALAAHANAWFGTGHLLVTRMAHDILMKKSPETVTKVEEILAVLKTTGSSWASKEKDHPFVECATFADDIKRKGGAFQNNWHFIDTPFLDEGGKISDYNFTFDTHNITEVISAIVNFVNKADGYKDSYEYEQLMKNTYNVHTEQVAMSTAMRLLLHYVGDIHQPLHSTSRVDHEFPKGDRGGNDFKLAPDHGIKELHAVWDSIIFEYTGYAVLPYTADSWKIQGENATKMFNAYDISDKEATNLDPVVWANEAFEISENFVYKDIKQNEVLPQTYDDKARKLAEKQVVLAGHRLANLLLSLNLDNWKTTPVKTYYEQFQDLANQMYAEGESFMQN